MKSFVLALTLLVSFSSFASVDSIKLVLEQNEVEKLAESLSEKGYSLSQITDVYASRGIRPRCPCESFEITFSQYGSKSKKYSVSTNGFGNSLKVTIKEEK